MQRETFYEESAVPVSSLREAKLYKMFHIAQIVAIVLLCALLLFFVPYWMSRWGLYRNGDLTIAEFFVLIIPEVMLIVFIGVAALIFFFIKRRFNISYDYSFVDDELRVSKVFNGKRRKFLVRLEAEYMLKLGWADRESFQRTCAGMDRKSIRFLTPNKAPVEGKEFYYVLYTTSLGKTVYVLEARQEMLECLVRAAGVNKLERA